MGHRVQLELLDLGLQQREAGVGRHQRTRRRHVQRRAFPGRTGPDGRHREILPAEQPLVVLPALARVLAGLGQRLDVLLRLADLLILDLAAEPQQFDAMGRLHQGQLLGVELLPRGQIGVIDRDEVGGHHLEGPGEGGREPPARRPRRRAAEHRVDVEARGPGADQQIGVEGRVVEREHEGVSVDVTAVSEVREPPVDPVPVVERHGAGRDAEIQRAERPQVVRRRCPVPRRDRGGMPGWSRMRSQP